MRYKFLLNEHEIFFLQYKTKLYLMQYEGILSNYYDNQQMAKGANKTNR